MRNRIWMPVIILLVLALVLAACSSSDTAATASGTIDGQALFQETLVNQSPGCITCHSLEADVRLVGPSIAGVASRAEAFVNSADYSGSADTAAAYLRESIVDPDAYVPDGYIAGTMYQRYETSLTSTQIDALVDYMLTLK